MGKIPLTGGAYMAHSVIAAAQRSVNLYSEPMPQAEGEPAPAAHYPTPGTRLLGTLGTGPIRGIRQAPNGNLYAVSGSEVYRVDTTTWVGTKLGDITAGLRTPVSMADNGLDMVIVDGTSSGWHVTLADDTFGPIVQSETVTPVAAAFGEAIVAGAAFYTPFTSAIGGVITAATLMLSGTGYTGHMKCSIFADSAGRPADVLGSATPLTNPGTGVNLLSFPTSVAVTAGTQYWIGFDSDVSYGTWSLGPGGSGLTGTTPYASFPVASPSVAISTGPVCTVSFATDPGGMFTGGDHVDYLDTYLLFNKPGTPQFYSSDSLSLTFDPLWFANKQAYSDLLVTLAVVKRNIWLLGSQTTEIWADVGKPDFPFEAQADVFIDHGCVAKYSPAIYDNALFWLTADRQGRGIVIMGSGYQTKRVSMYAIEAEIAGYDRISDAIGFCYQMGGHTFYVLTFPHADKTWSYDVTTGLWHEWLWIDSNGEEHRHRANCFWPVNGTPVVGDWQDGRLWALDQRVYTDDGGPIKRVRSFPHLLNDGKRVFYRQFIADMETGTSTHVNREASTLLDARFTAPDGTNLADYVSDVGGGWAAVDGEDAAEIMADAVIGTGGEAMFRSLAVPTAADYAVRFNVVPPAYDSVVEDTSLWVIGRAAAINTGYRLKVSADGEQYTLSLAGGGVGGLTVPMGTLTSGTYTCWLSMRGQIITARVQRSQDALWLRFDGTWHSEPATVALQFNDGTYAAAGAIMIGGVWP